MTVLFTALLGLSVRSYPPLHPARSEQRPVLRFLPLSRDPTPETREREVLTDPTLFALPHPKGFSEPLYQTGVRTPLPDVSLPFAAMAALPEAPLAKHIEYTSLQVADWRTIRPPVTVATTTLSARIEIDVSDELLRAGLNMKPLPELESESTPAFFQCDLHLCFFSNGLPAGILLDMEDEAPSLRTALIRQASRWRTDGPAWGRVRLTYERAPKKQAALPP